MRQSAGVLLVVCVCLLLGVSLVQSAARRRSIIPLYCRQFIHQASNNAAAAANTQSANATQADNEDADVEEDGGVEDELESDDEAGDVDDPMKAADEEIKMLRLMIDFMT